MVKQKYTFFSAGELENEIAGKWAFMVYASKLADEFYDGVNDNVIPMMQDTVDDLYDAYAEIKDENIKGKALKQLRAWLEAVIHAFEVIETSVADPAIRGVFENKVAGKGAQSLGTLVAHALCKGQCR